MYFLYNAQFYVDRKKWLMFLGTYAHFNGKTEKNTRILIPSNFYASPLVKTFLMNMN